MLTISDVIAFTNGSITEPIADVKVTAEPGGDSVITDAKGRYTVHSALWMDGTADLQQGRSCNSIPTTSRSPTSPATIVNGQPQPSNEWPPYDRAPTTPSRPPVALPAAAGNVFVIPTAQVVPDKVAETAEDLRIMLQILREKLSEPRLIRGRVRQFR